MAIELFSGIYGNQLEHFADKYLVRLYGNQDKAISDWYSGKKSVLIDVESGIVRGFIALSDKPQKSYVKISTLLVDDDFKGMGIARRLLGSGIDFSRENTSKECISVTVNETIEDSIRFFERNGFSKVGELYGRYIPDQIEYILSRKLR